MSEKRTRITSGSSTIRFTEAGISLTIPMVRRIPARDADDKGPQRESLKRNDIRKGDKS